MGTAISVPAASSPVTANELSTAGPMPLMTAFLMAVVEDSSRVGRVAHPGQPLGGGQQVDAALEGAVEA